MVSKEITGELCTWSAFWYQLYNHAQCCHIISSLSLNHHLYTDDTTFPLTPSIQFPLQHHSLTKCSTTYFGWLPIFLLSTLLKLSFCLLDLNNNFLKYTTAVSLQSAPLGIFTLFLTNTLPSLTKSVHFLSLASCYYHIRELRCSSYLGLNTSSTIATSIVHSKLDYCNSLYHNLSNYQLNQLQQIQNSCSCCC